MYGLYLYCLDCKLPVNITGFTVVISNILYHLRTLENREFKDTRVESDSFDMSWITPYKTLPWKCTSVPFLLL